MVVKTKKVSKNKLITTRGIQTLTHGGNINSHFAGKGIFFQKRINSKTFHWEHKYIKNSFSKGHKAKYSNVCAYLKGGEWVVI